MTVDCSDDAADRDTGICTAAVPSPPPAAAASKATAGGWSSSVMVTVWVVIPPRVTLTVSPRVTWTVSFSSSVVSLTTETWMVSTVVPALKVRVPEARV